MANRKKKVTEFFGDPPKEIRRDEFYDVELDDEQLEMANAIWSPDFDIIFTNAKAGTGKTFIATGVANMLVQYGLYDEIIYIMSPYGERKQGWLPGSITEKSAVYFEAFYQALVKCNVNINSAINTDSMANQKEGTGYITCITDTFLRGSNLDRAVIILDESQNYTTSQLKKVLTRMGKNSKVIVIGHDEQCDLDFPELSGFTKYIDHYKGQDRAAFCTLVNNHRGWISQHADTLVE